MEGERETDGLLLSTVQEETQDVVEESFGLLSTDLSTDVSQEEPKKEVLVSGMDETTLREFTRIVREKFKGDVLLETERKEVDGMIQEEQVAVPVFMTREDAKDCLMHFKGAKLQGVERFVDHLISDFEPAVDYSHESRQQRRARLRREKKEKNRK